MTRNNRLRFGVTVLIGAVLVAIGLWAFWALWFPPPIPELTGTYRADDGGIYYVQRSGSTLWWAGLSLDRQLPADYIWHRGLYFTNVFRGTINSDNTVVGAWADVTRGASLNGGTLRVKIGSSGGVTQLRKLAATGGFGATTWTKTDPLDDTKFNGTTLDIISRFDAVHKNNAAGSDALHHNNLKPYRDATVFYGRLINSHIKYTDDELPVESEIPHVNYGPDSEIPQYPDFGHEARDFKTFACYDGDNDDADFDMRLKVDLDKIEPDFYTTGWGDRTYGPEVFRLKLNDASTRTKLNFAGSDAYMGLEAIMLGKAGTCDSLQDATYGFASLLPGWADLFSASVLVNGRPINGNLSSPQPSATCDFIQPCPYVPDGVNSSNYLVNPAGIQLGNLLISAYGDGKVPPGSGIGTYMRITGTLVLDCGHSPFPYVDHPCWDGDDENPDNDPGDVSSHQNQEIHPIYSIDVINYPYRPEDINVPGRMNLTGTYGGSDGSTYYVLQTGGTNILQPGKTIWWLGLMRDRQPMQRGTHFPIIGGKQLKPAFDANDPPCPSGQCWAFANVFKGTITESPIQTVIEGDWVGVPQSTSAGSSGGHMKFFVFNHKIIIPAMASIFPVTIEKMYEPPDTTASQGTLTIGTR